MAQGGFSINPTRSEQLLFLTDDQLRQGILTAVGGIEGGEQDMAEGEVQAVAEGGLELGGVIGQMGEELAGRGQVGHGGAAGHDDACGGVQGRDVLGVGAGQHIGDDLDDHVDGIGCLALDRGQIDVLARDGIRDDVVELQAGHDEVGGEG